jgi:hypothetical protein
MRSVIYYNFSLDDPADQFYSRPYFLGWRPDSSAGGNGADHLCRYNFRKVFFPDMAKNFLINFLLTGSICFLIFWQSAMNR